MSVHAADDLARHIDGESAGSIARSIASLVRDDVLHPGDRLPTVRALATSLHVGRSAVTDAWGILIRHGVITTARRNGTVVRDRPGRGQARYWSVPAAPGSLRIDLSTGTPDTELLPPLGPALRRISHSVGISSYVDPPVLPELEDELRRRWPTTPETMTVVDGALDALDRIVAELVSFGDVVLVEDPTFPPLLDMLELAGATVIGIPVDENGPIVEATAAAMERRPSAVFFQPYAHNPTGASLSNDRAATLAGLFGASRNPPWIVEDDHTAGLFAGAPSITEHLPERSITIISFSKTHGPDLRVAAIGGPTSVLDGVIERRRLGPIWTSRLVQELLLEMLTDDATRRLVADARCEYARRRVQLSELLGAADLRPTPGSGLNMWLPVEDEQRTTWALAIDQIGVAPGRPFAVTEPRGGHLRISLGNARTDDLDQIARSVIGATSR